MSVSAFTSGRRDPSGPCRYPPCKLEPCLIGANVTFPDSRPSRLFAHVQPGSSPCSKSSMYLGGGSGGGASVIGAVGIAMGAPKPCVPPADRYGNARGYDCRSGDSRCDSCACRAEGEVVRKMSIEGQLAGVARGRGRNPLVASVGCKQDVDEQCHAIFVFSGTGIVVAT